MDLIHVVLKYSSAYLSQGLIVVFPVNMTYLGDKLLNQTSHALPLLDLIFQRQSKLLILNCP